MIDENSTFGGFLTDIGEAKQTNANALEIPWKLTHMLLGDANGTDPVPDPEQTQLINQVYRAGINQLFVDPDNPAILIAEMVLPPNVGGWWIRELALEDEDGDFVAVANCAPSYKPLLAQGSGRNQVVRMHLIVSNTANVQLKIDPSVVLATRQYVDDQRAEHEASRNHPAATEAEQGMVQLATSAQAREGTRTDRGVHPAGLLSAIRQFGIGGSAPLLPGNTLNYSGGTIPPGLYSFNPDTVDKPSGISGSSWGNVLVTRRASTGGETQLLMCDSPSRSIYTRSRATGGWSAWSEILHGALFTGANHLLAGSGYQPLPGGLIFQWGTANNAGPGNKIVDLPIQFPSNFYAVVASAVTTSNEEHGYFCSASRVNLSSFRYSSNGYIDTSGNIVKTAEQNSPTVDWFAIGR